MGGIASKVKGHIWTRNVQRFNIEARTSKLLEREKPIPAPKYPVDAEILKSLQENMRPEDKALDSDLNAKLKKVYVTSTDPEPGTYNLDVHVKTHNPDRPLPTRAHLDFRPSKPTKKPPKEINDGRLTLAEVSDLLLDARSKPPLTIEELQKKYKTDRDLHDLIYYYRIFQKFTKEDNVPKEPKDPLLPGPDWETKKES